MQLCLTITIFVIAHERKLPTSIQIDMMIKHKEVYESPDMKVLELKTQVVLCLSNPADYTNGGDPFNPVIS